MQSTNAVVDHALVVTTAKPDTKLIVFAVAELVGLDGEEDGGGVEDWADVSTAEALSEDGAIPEAAAEESDGAGGGATAPALDGTGVGDGIKTPEVSYWVKMRVAVASPGTSTASSFSKLLPCSQCVPAATNCSTS